MDFRLFTDALLTGTPLVILATVVGLVWQAIYTLSRDKINKEQARRALEFEEEKLKHQKVIEELRFCYEQRRWREVLAHDITLKLVEARLAEYSKVWSYIEGVAISEAEARTLSPDATKAIATKIKNWRYSPGGLLAQSVTRDAAFTLQTLLWNYDGSEAAYRRIREARRIFRDALRADIGLGKNAVGESILDTVETMHNIRKDLENLQTKSDINKRDVR